MEEIRKFLLSKENYSPAAARSAAKHLCSMKSEDLQKALKIYMWGKGRLNVKRGPFSARGLMEKRHMKYPAALIFLDWYDEDPAAALDSLAHGGV